LVHRVMANASTSPTVDASDFAARLAAATQALIVGDHAACVAACQSLHAEALLVGDMTMAAEAAVLLAKDFANQLDALTAQHWAKQGLQAATQAPAPALQAVAWVVIASTSAQQEQPVEAIAAMQQALDLLDERMPGDVQRTVFTGVGLSYMSMGMPIQALEALRKAAEMAVKLGGSASLVARARVNVLYAAVASYDLMLSVDPTGAAQLLAQAQAECEQLKSDAGLAGNQHARSSYCHTAGMVMHRAGQLEQARALLTEISVEDAQVSHYVKRDLLIALGRVAMAQTDTAAAIAFAKRALLEQPLDDTQLRHAGDLLRASELADLLGDAPRALALHKRYHARVVRNEHAAFDARVADLSATVAAQSMRLEINELQQRNAGLSSTFKQLSDLALTDALTGAANRRGLEEAFTQLRANGQAVVLAMLDLDHFKQVNDRFSHVVGDQVLRQAAQLMAESLRDRDQLGRFGGEEFTALLVDAALPEAVVVAERLRERVQAFDWDQVAKGLVLTISVGIVTVRSGEPFQQAVGRADVLLYAAKTQGRNRVLAESVDTPPTDGV
jgi:diguanylate cyclase (GGDEF)-like protein